MAVVLKSLGLASGGGPENEYLVSFDPEAHDGGGDATFDPDLARALRFPDFAAAYTFYGQRPCCRPTRRDGKPNRPLTAFTMQFERVPDEAEITPASLQSRSSANRVRS